jgi:hypothetical protein
MTSIVSSLSGAPQFSPSFLSGGQSQTNQTTLHASSSTTANLTVLTAEGDKITISRRTDAQVAYSNYNALGQTDGQAVSYREQSLEFDRQGEFQLSVEGDLSQQERADLNKLVKKIDRVIRDFLKGDTKGAISKTLQINKLGSLSSVDLSVEHTETLTVARQQTVQASDSEASNPADDPAAPTSAADLIRQIVKAVKESRIDLGKLKTHLPNALASLFQTLGLGSPEQLIKQVFADSRPS